MARGGAGEGKGGRGGGEGEGEVTRAVLSAAAQGHTEVVEWLVKVPIPLSLSPYAYRPMHIALCVSTYAYRRIGV